MNFLQKSSQILDKENNIDMLITCAFHKDKIITNFCSTYSCLLPMCPTCVSIHSQEHREQNTHGQFLSLQQIIDNTYTLLFKTSKTLEDMSEQYTEDYWNKQKILESCKQNLQSQKKRLIKEIQRKFQQIQYKMIRKINQFQDSIHDRYKQLETQLQYLYDSLNKQRQDLGVSNDKVLKNIIHFYSQRKQDKIKEWVNKFRVQIDDLKQQSIRIKCNQEFLDIPKTLDYYFNIENFKDEENEYLISTGRELISSNTKRKTTESPRWTSEKQNYFTVRTNHQKNPLEKGKSPISQLNQFSAPQVLNQKQQNQWSASKY